MASGRQSTKPKTGAQRMGRAETLDRHAIFVDAFGHKVIPNGPSAIKGKMPIALEAAGV